jgi:outer membrane receptor protein involved in Fe transport
MNVRDGSFYNNVQRQLNFVDTFSWAVGVHQLKFGIDYRRLRPTSGQSTGYGASAGYAELVAGTVSAINLSVDDLFSVNANNYSLFAQDTWKVKRNLTLTYGVAVGDQHTAGFGNVRPTALRAARNLRLESARSAARFALAYQVRQSRSPDRSRIPAHP